jgi:hypothetical protein
MGPDSTSKWDRFERALPAVWATPEGRLQIFQRHIEVVELGPIDQETRTGN